ncbi:cell division protein DivIVA [Streptomyces sp. NPDC001828]|uniref:cell division protein DivIVA n=1 Tax=Streptomyces sp. NPDC001828 TaxID=3364615 RepID=UPI0036AC1B4E
MFWFLLIAMVVVVTAVTLAVVGGGGDEAAVLSDAEPEHLVDPLPEHRPVARADVEALRIPVVLRGYRMADVDDVLSRLGAELAERDARIAELQSAAGPAARERRAPAGPPASAQPGPAAPDTRDDAFPDTRQDASSGSDEDVFSGSEQGPVTPPHRAGPTDEEPRR